MRNDLGKICPNPVRFCVDWIPEKGLVVKSSGEAPAITLMTCMALMHTTMGSVKEEKRTPAGTFDVICKALKMAQLIFENSDMCITDMKELRKQAADEGL